jgi:hypothetical protein
LLDKALLTITGTLAAAALGRRYCSVSCAGIAAVDAGMRITVPLVISIMTSPVVLAMAASLASITILHAACARAG